MNTAAGYSDRKWAVQVKQDEFFIDTWEWKAMPFISDDTLGETEFGGKGCRCEEAARQMAQSECQRRGIFEAEMLGPDDIEE